MTTPPAVAVIPAVAPTIVIAPYVPLGEPALGVIYDTSAGTWNGALTLTYLYQWYDCNASGTTCMPIAGATGTSYVLAATDLGHYLEVVVTATNSGGTTQGESNLEVTSD